MILVVVLFLLSSVELKPYTLYTVMVLAVNQEGDGPPSSVTEWTQEECKSLEIALCFMIRLFNV